MYENVNHWVSRGMDFFYKGKFGRSSPGYGKPLWKKAAKHFFLQKHLDTSPPHLVCLDMFEELFFLASFPYPISLKILDFGQPPSPLPYPFSLENVPTEADKSSEKVWICYTFLEDSNNKKTPCRSRM